MFLEVLFAHPAHSGPFISLLQSDGERPKAPFQILPVNKHISHSAGTILTKSPKDTSKFRKGAKRVVGSTL